MAVLQSTLSAAAIWTARERRRTRGRRASAIPEGHAVIREAAHTLRTPLIVARSHAEFVLSGLEPGTASHRDAVVVVDELRRAARISDQLLALGTTDRVAPLVLAPVDTGALALKVARRWSAATDREIAVDAGEPVIVPADEQRLRDALDALVENALRACGPLDRITVGTRAVGDRALVSVSDTGPGLAAQELERIVARLERGGAAGPGPAAGAPGAGTGLGLAIVRAIAEAHGGRVEVDSEPGRGTTFTLCLGRAQRPASLHRRVRARRRRGAPAKRHA